MLALGQIGRPISCRSSINGKAESGVSLTGKHLNLTAKFIGISESCDGSRNYFRCQLPLRNGRNVVSPIFAATSSAGNSAYIEEPATKVKFLKSIDVPGSSSSLLLLGTGYREKSFAFIGVKVYAAGLYVNPHVFNELSTWKGKSAASIQEDRALFNSLYQSTLEKTLQICLVRDVDGKTFWEALDEAVSPRINSPTSTDETALANFRSIFSGRSLSKGTLINLTWLEPCRMLVSVPSGGGATAVDATIESMNVTRALFDVFLGESSVSPHLKGIRSQWFVSWPSLRQACGCP